MHMGVLLNKYNKKQWGKHNFQIILSSLWSWGWKLAFWYRLVFYHSATHWTKSFLTQENQEFEPVF